MFDDSPGYAYSKDLSARGICPYCRSSEAKWGRRHSYMCFTCKRCRAAWRFQTYYDDETEDIHTEIQLLKKWELTPMEILKIAIEDIDIDGGAR